MPRQMVVDCAVVGAGPAGLAASAALSARGIDHVVLERGRAGENWRGQRWNSFRLNTPGWMNGLLGEQARDAYATGAEVVERLERLATSPVGRLPWRHRGRDTIDWLVEAGFFDQRPRDLPDPSVMRAAQPVLASGGRSLSLPALARAGATLVGRPVAVDGERISFDGSVQANIAAGDAFAAWVRAMADEGLRWLIRRSSGILLGFPTDASVVADAIKAQLSPSTAGRG